MRQKLTSIGILCGLALTILLARSAAMAEGARSGGTAESSRASIDASSIEDFAKDVISPYLSGKIVVVNSVVDVRQSITIPADRIVKIIPGGYFNIAEGVTLAFNCSIEASPFRIFSGSGRVALGGKIGTVYAEWWGASNDVSIDSTDALQKAINTHRPVQLMPGTYRITSPLSIRSSNVSVRGAGMYSTTIQCDGSEYGIYADPGQFINGVVLEGFQVTGARKDGLAMRNVVERSCVIRSVATNHNGRHGINIIDCHGLVVNQCEARNNAACGFIATHSQAAMFIRCFAAANQVGYLLQDGGLSTIEDSWSEANSLYQIQIGSIDGFVLQNNWLETHSEKSGSAIFINNERKNYAFGVITGNFIGATFGLKDADGITIFNGEKINISNNRIQGGRRAGIYIGSVASEITMSNNAVMGYSEGIAGIIDNRKRSKP